MFDGAICTSEVVLIQRTGRDLPEGAGALETRLNSVLVAQNYLMMDYNVAEVELAATT